MKKIPLIILIPILLLIQSCQDVGNDGFVPSLELDEYVLMKVDGNERIYTSDNYIEVVHQISDDESRLHISLWPEEGTYTHFILELKEPALGIFQAEQLSFNYLDYPLVPDAYPTLAMDCTEWGCNGSMQVTIHEYGQTGEKLIGEISGELENGLLEGGMQSFNGEFVVYIDD